MKRWAFTYFYIFLISIFTSFSALSNSFCEANNFEDIELACIKDFGELEKLRVPFSTLKNNSILYYLTSAGSFGKLRVHSARKNGRGDGCQINFDFETFKGSQVFSRSVTKTIKKKMNVWEVQKINLDQGVNPYDIQLNFYQNECYIESLSAKISYVDTLQSFKPKSFQLIFYTAIILIGFAFFNIAKMIFEDENQYRSSEVIEESSSLVVTDKDSSFILKYSTPFFRRYVNPVVNGMKNKRSIIEKYKKTLASAGVNRYLSAIDFYSFKIFSILTFPVIYLALRSLFEADWPLILTPIMGALGFIYPDIWAKSKADKRKEEVIMNLPFAIDMLALSVEAGLDFIAAMRKVVNKASPSALRDEFETVIKEIQLGSTRAQALKQMAWRVDALVMTSFCATLIAADSVGASIGPILKSLSFEMRNKRSALIEKKGAEASSKLLFPMVVFILPAIIIMVLLPMGLDLLGSR